MTRFPIPKGDSFYQDTVNYRGLVRASDLIGQLGDPQYLKKQPALFYEFSELGINDKFGYLVWPAFFEPPQSYNCIVNA